MKRSSRTRLPLLLIASLLVSGSAFADYIVLKSGERINGRIVSEDADKVSIEYILIPGSKIKDTKTYPKADIKELVKFTPSQLEFEEKELKKIVPTADMLTASDYETIIQDRLRPFAAKYPGTPETKEVEGMIATLSEEKNKVMGGQVKMEGQWLDETAVKREKYNIEAYKQRMNMKANAADLSNDQAQPKEIKALREWDILKTNYPASMQYFHAIPEALEILDKYEKRLLAMAGEQPILKAEREKAAKTNPQAKIAIEQEDRVFKATIEAQLKAKIKWRDISKFDKLSIGGAQNLVVQEKQALKSINLPALQAEIESLNEAIRYITEGNAAEADNAMNRLRPNKTNLINKKVFDDYEKKLKELQTKLVTEAKAAKASASAATPSTSGAENSRESVNPIADAMAKKKEAARLKDEERKKKAQADAAANAGKSTAAAPEEEETMLQKINKYIPFIGGGLLVILIIAMVMGKKKKDDDE